MTKIEILLKSGKTVFTIDDLCVYWIGLKRKDILESARDYVRRGRLTRIRSGLYSLGDSQPLEIAQKLVVPSYISGYTALAHHGIIFQDYGSQIHCMATKSINYKIQGWQYIYHQLKSDVFFSPLGINKGSAYNIASPERAVADMLYLNKNLGFDNLRPVNFDLLKEIAPIYQQQSLAATVERLIAYA